MNNWQDSVSTYGGGVMASQPSTIQYNVLSTVPGSVHQGVAGPSTHSVQGLTHHSVGQRDEEGLNVLQELVQGPEQAIWLQQELAKRPLQPGQSPLHWVIWREKCEEGYDPNTAWQLALEDERKATAAQEAQNNQQYQSQQQAGFSPAPTTINPAQIHAAGPYQDPSLSYGSYQQAGYVGYVGGPSEDPRQGGHAHMHDASPVQSTTNAVMTYRVVPTNPDAGSGQDVAAGQPVASSSGQTLNMTPASRVNANESSTSGSPLDSLNRVHAPLHPTKPLGLRRVSHSKRPIMPLSAFDKLVPLPPNRVSASWSSSALDPKPTKEERQALAAKRSNLGGDVGSTLVEKPSNWAVVQSCITPEALHAGKPIHMFKLLRMRRDAQDEILGPVFVPDSTQTLEILLQLKNHAPPIYLQRVGENEKYALVLRKWLMKCTKDTKEWEKCMVPLLQVLAKTPVSVDTVVEYKFVRHAQALVEKAQREGIKSVADVVTAYNHYEKFVKTMIHQSQEAKKREEANRSTAGESRENETAGAAKRQKADDGSARPIVKSEAIGSAKSSADMSFFGSGGSTSAGPSKPKAKLPDIKKRDPSEIPPTLAATPAAGLLAATMQALRQPSQPMTAALTSSVPEIVEIKPTGPKPNKKGHIVRFRDTIENGGDLVNIREFKEEVWELERAPWQHDDDVAGKTAHQLDMGEGRALRIHETMETEIDWYDPQPYSDGPNPIEPTPEMIEQEARERGILGVVYNPGEVPPDPDEAGVRVIQRGASTGTWWPPSHDFDAPAPHAASAPDPQAAASVSALLGKLKPDLFVPPPAAPPPAQGYAYSQPPGSYDYNYGAQGYQAPAQGYGGWTDPAAAGPGPSGGSAYRGYGYEQHDRRVETAYSARSRGGQSNRGGGGRGKKSSNIVCKHWLVNACYKGDSCNYKHSRD